jgi:hypothetical protein
MKRKSSVQCAFEDCGYIHARGAKFCEAHEPPPDHSAFEAVRLLGLRAIRRILDKRRKRGP